MALVKGKECGESVSSKAKTCPKCGARVAKKPMGCVSLVGIVIFGFFVISILSKTPESGKSDQTGGVSSIRAPIDRGIPVQEKAESGSQWSNYQTDDQMGKGVIYHALVSSSNTVNFGFPYSGPQRGSLSLLTHPRYGKDVIFTIEKGQILCRSYDGCEVLVRFDDEDAVKYSAVGTADNSTETIFIKNYDGFVKKLIAAKRVRISVDIYQEGSPVFDFDVRGFSQEKYRKKG